MLRNIDHYIRHYRARLPHETERQDRIYIRMADIFDAFDDDPRHVVRVFKLLGASPITGILYEDVRDSRFTFESNALVRLMRRYLPRPRKIPVHPHSGNGMEDAATIEAVVAGANDVWSGFTPQAAQGGRDAVRERPAHGRPRRALVAPELKTGYRQWQVSAFPAPPRHSAISRRSTCSIWRFVGEGEFLTLLGPSGCGKTTTRRLIAGFIQPTSGIIYLGDDDITGMAPQPRRIGMVFQDYALFPHMTVRQNIAFGLEERRYDKHRIPERADKLLRSHPATRHGRSLPSEGERRAAPAHRGGPRGRLSAAVSLLMDEPLGALDLKRREAMQIEIRRIQRGLSITTGLRHS